jgi:hypothetical protein
MARCFIAKTHSWQIPFGQLQRVIWSCDNKIRVFELYRSLWSTGKITVCKNEGCWTLHTTACSIARLRLALYEDFRGLRGALAPFFNTPAFAFGRVLNEVATMRSVRFVIHVCPSVIVTTLKSNIRPDDGGSKVLRNVGKFLPDYTALQPRRQPSSYQPQWEPQILQL